jgi:signal peptidase I
MNKPKASHFLWIPLFLILGLAGCQHTVTIRISGNSMMPNYPDGTVIYLEPVVSADLHRGDVVYFDLDSTRAYVKRIVGLPGESVAIHDQNIYINGKLLVENYKATQPTYEMAEKSLGKDEFFLLGDNRNYSADSHVLDQYQQLL